MLLAAAAAGYDANRERFRSLPPDRARAALGNLRRFDLELTPEQQSAARELDSRLAEMDAREAGRVPGGPPPLPRLAQQPAGESAGRGVRPAGRRSDGAGPQADRGVARPHRRYAARPRPRRARWALRVRVGVRLQDLAGASAEQKTDRSRRSARNEQRREELFRMGARLKPRDLLARRSRPTTTRRSGSA